MQTLKDNFKKSQSNSFPFLCEYKFYSEENIALKRNIQLSKRYNPSQITNFISHKNIEATMYRCSLNDQRTFIL